VWHGWSGDLGRRGGGGRGKGGWSGEVEMGMEMNGATLKDDWLRDYGEPSHSCQRSRPALNRDCQIERALLSHPGFEMHSGLLKRSSNGSFGNTYTAQKFLIPT